MFFETAELRGLAGFPYLGGRWLFFTIVSLDPSISIDSLTHLRLILEQETQ